MRKACRLKFLTETHKKRKRFCRKRIIEDLVDVRTVNNVNNDIDLSVNNMNNNDSNVNSTNNDIHIL